MMEVMFRARGNRIEPLTVVRQTEKMVVLPFGKSTRKEAKRTGWGSWHDTWEEAHAFLLERAERKLESIRYQLQQAQGEYGNIKGMKKP